MQRTLNPLNSLVLKKYDGFNMDELWFLDHVKMIPFTLAPLGIKSHPLPKTIPPTKNRPENRCGWGDVCISKPPFRLERMRSKHREMHAADPEVSCDSGRRRVEPSIMNHQIGM